MKSNIITFLTVTAMFYICLGQTYPETKVFDTITNTNAEPFNVINWQEAYRNRNVITFRGDYSPSSTSFFIDKNLILTAGHNVHTDFFSRIDWLKVIPGMYKETKPLDSLIINGRKKFKEVKRTPNKFSFSKRWKKRIKWDFALVYIPDIYLTEKMKNINRKIFVLDENYILKKGDTIHVAGYPADGNNDGKYFGDLMIYQIGEVQKIGDKHFYHNFYTEKGNSGSPIWVEHEGKRIIVGVHTFPNKGTLLDKENILIIKSWMSEILD
ncbi:hypothetical protein A9Q86_10410 [Flavobacteriales bacterium 33_180_T64]|nr:hypothetical protein A9Q86_10410 [Flavobacteriales bacterium 33_180_T64]